MENKRTRHKGIAIGDGGGLAIVIDDFGIGTIVLEMSAAEMWSLAQKLAHTAGRMNALQEIAAEGERLDTGRYGALN